MILSRKRYLAGVGAYAVLAGMAAAHPPNVVTDIAPVHSLVAQVTEGVTEPALIIPPNQSPHYFSMRPSTARSLQDADLVIWVGRELTPWLEKPIKSLASDTQQIELLELPETATLEFREHAVFGGDGHGDADDHGHDNHDHHEEAHDHDHHEEAHDHHGVDPHAWLSPDNAQAWLTVIAASLSGIDPDNASTYAQNAETAIAELQALSAELQAQLAGAGERPVLTMHDAYQYFETHFGLRVIGSISPGDAAAPSPARIAALRDAVVDHNVTCAFSEPQYDTRLISAVAEDTGLEIAVLDPLGAQLPIGPDLYLGILTQMAEAVADCG